MIKNELRIKKIFPFLFDLNQNEIEELMHKSNIIKYEPNTEIIYEIGACSNVSFVLSGRIRIYKISPEGKEITMYRIKEGQTCILSITCILGETDYPMMANSEIFTEILSIPAVLFRKYLFLAESWQKYIFSSLTERLFDVMGIVETVVFNSIEKRITKYLLENKENNKNYLKITHEKIAFDIGSAREVVSRTLKELESFNFVKLKRGLIEIINEKELRRLL